MSNARELAGYASSLPSLRNKIINGGMKISQRNTSFTFAHNGTLEAYTLDRFNFRCGGVSQYNTTVSQYSMSAAELNATGHSKALKIVTGNSGAESAISSGTNVRLEYKAEAQDLQDLQYGTASAKTMTLSFWVKSSVAGTYAVNLYKADTTSRMINKTYTINTADTWEKKIISIVGDTDSTGSIDDDNGEGLRIMWVLATGSTYNSSSAATWTNFASGNFLAGHVQNGVVTTANANWYLTGVQLEIGTVGTAFEHRHASVELSLCQRYYERFDGYMYGGADANNYTWWGTVFFKVEKRAVPTTAYNVLYSTISDISKQKLVISRSLYNFACEDLQIVSEL